MQFKKERQPARSSIQARKLSSKLKFAVGFSAVALSIAVAAVAQNAVLKGTVLKELDVKPNAALIDKYGDAANDPAVADVLRKAQGQQTTDQLKETSNTYEALQNGTWKPGADPTTAIMYGYVPPNMSPEQAQILYKHLPHLPQMPRPMSAEEMAGERGDQMPLMAEPMSPYVPYPESLTTREPKTRQLQTIPQQMLPGQMAGIPGMPMMGFDSGMGYGLSSGEIAAQNQSIAEEAIRARFGPVAVPTLQPGHNWLAEQARKNAASKHVAESDHQSVVGVCDASGNEITSIQYDPWGNQTVLSGGTVMPTFGYKGMYYLPRANLYLTLYRPYSPALGRFLTRDPIGEAGGTNLYAFVGNNPISLQDPLGLYVNATYSQSSHTFTAYDTANPLNTYFTSSDIFSGNTNFTNNPFFEGLGGRGPIPQGDYFIEPRIPIPGEANYEYPLTSMATGLQQLFGVPWTSRGGFTIHPGLMSNGCITFKSTVPTNASNYPTNPAFDQLSNLLQNTSPLNVNGVNLPGVLRVVP